MSVSVVCFCYTHTCENCFIHALCYCIYREKYFKVLVVLSSYNLECVVSCDSVPLKPVLH